MSQRQVTTVEIPWRTIFRLLAAAALVWCWLQLTTLFLLLLVTALLAVTLDPLVRRLEPHDVPRPAAAAIIVLAPIAIFMAFAYVLSSQLTEQSHVLGSSLASFEGVLLHRFPAAWVKWIVGDTNKTLQAYLAPVGFSVARGIAGALVVIALATILTLYLLIEGRATYRWLLAFVPLSKRRKVGMTAEECQRVIFGYVAGNLATSVFATLFVFASLSLLRVPAALLLALLAGLCDFVPVLGFAVSAIPAVLLAQTV